MPANSGAANGGTPETLKDQLLEWGRAAVPTVASAIGFTGFVSILGAAVIWTQFDAAGLPADQAVHDLPLSEMLVRGAVSLTLYLVLGLLAVLLVYLLQGVVIAQSIDVPKSGDPKGRLQRELALVEAREKALGKEVAELAAGGHIPDPGLPAGARYAALKSEAEQLGTRHDELSRKIFEAEQNEVEAGGRGSQWGLLALLGAELLVILLRTDITTFGKVSLGVSTGILTAVLLAGITSIDPKANTWGDIVAVVAVVLFGAFAGLLMLERPWTFVPVLAAVLLALAVLAVGRLHPRQFFWYGISIFASVGLFGAVLTYSRDRHFPEAQPAAVLLKNGCAVDGLWIGEGDKRVFLARLGAPGAGSDGGPSGPGRVFWLDRSNVVSESVGKLQGLTTAASEAAGLRTELMTDAGTARLTGEHCEASAPAPSGAAGGAAKVG